MLISKTVITKWSGNNREYYEDKGYVFTKFFEEFEVKIEDLTDGSIAKVEVKCDCEDCENPYIKQMKWQDYLCQIKKSGKYYCNKCASKLYGKENMIKARLKNGKSFENWCIENNRQDVLDRWDYEKNDKLPSEINYGTGTTFWIKCNKHRNHKSELKYINSFTSGQEGSMYCNQCNSIAQWGIDNLGEDFLEKYWDYEKNVGINPFEISYGCNNKVWIKCQEKDYHGSYNISCNNFTKGKRCPFCINHRGKVHLLDSFAQWGIDNIGEDFLEKYWSEKNMINPWDIPSTSSKKVWIKCKKIDYHEDYKIGCDSFALSGNRCSYCNSKASSKLHPLDSLGQLLEDENLLHLWSEKNEKSPYEYAPKSSKKAWFKCPDEKHEESYRCIAVSNKSEFRCPECQFSKGEKRIEEYLIHNKIEYIPQHEYEGLIGLGDGNLSYDFYLPKYNLLIEYQGEFHDGTAKLMTDEDFIKQQEHDRRKKLYAENNKIELLPIWYWDYENIEKILNNKIKEIHKYIPTETNTYLNA